MASGDTRQDVLNRLVDSLNTLRSAGRGDDSDEQRASRATATIRSAGVFRETLARLSPEERKRVVELLGLAEKSPADDSKGLEHEAKRTFYGILTFTGIGFGSLFLGGWISWLGWGGLFYGIASFAFVMVAIGFVIWNRECKAVQDARTIERALHSMRG